MKSNIKSYKIWFTHPAPLEDLGQLLLKNKVLNQVEFDYENVYEWLEASSTITTTSLNFSRKHNFHTEAEELATSNPISVLLSYEEQEPSDAVVEEIAEAIHAVLNCTVFLGSIQYTGGDSYHYHPTKKILAKKP